jgi:hypothetical protein
MNFSFRTALIITVGLLAACGGKTETDNGELPESAKIPARPLPTVNVASCSESGIDINLTPLEIEDARISGDASYPLYAQFSDCPASSAVRVDYHSKIKVSFERPRSLLAFGPDYFPTRGELIPSGVAKDGMDAYLGAYALREHLWRPRLPNYRADAPSLVMIVRGPGGTPLPASSTCADPTVHVDAPSANVTHADSGIVVVDGLDAGPAPRIDITPPSGCSVERSTIVAPLENGVVSLQFVMMK